MKNKSTKLNRRAAGLPIRATLEPRPDLGSNPATDIFRAARENDENEAAREVSNKNETAEKTENMEQNVQSAETEAVINSESLNSNENSENEAEVVPGTALVRFGGGQMRVVSLQPPKARKIQKKPRKVLKLISNPAEDIKIPQLFERTKAEELYDLLFQLTLGADEPCNTVRVRRSDLMFHTNIKTRLTLDLNLKRLEENGLISIESRPGEQEGNIYTVFPLPNAEK